MNTAAAEQQLSEFVGRYTPKIAAELQRCRAKLRASIPHGYELIYDNYNALVLAFGPSERASAAVVSLAAYPRWLTLFFFNGATLQDPESLLQGKGSRVRSIRLRAPEDLDSPSVHALVAQALTTLSPALAKAPPLRTIIKSVSAKQRPRRPSDSNKTVATPAIRKPKRSAK